MKKPAQEPVQITARLEVVPQYVVMIPVATVQQRFGDTYRLTEEQAGYTWYFVDRHLVGPTVFDYRNAISAIREEAKRYDTREEAEKVARLLQGVVEEA